ncbi:hypothetical protein F5X99DRAFT_408658 [Biscogniauxia marginata]|nr:hypothetical protein F5X99DRAFT_408658 [Biscogniauxia marginata]
MFTKVLASLFGIAAVNQDNQLDGTIARRKGPSGGPLLLADDGSSHDLSPPVIGAIVVGCVGVVIVVIVALARCTDCFACCRTHPGRSAQTDHDTEQGVVGITSGGQARINQQSMNGVTTIESPAPVIAMLVVSL